MMRKRSRIVLREEAFIGGAATEQEATEPQTVDLHRYVVRPRKWPLSKGKPTPSLAKGREDLKKPLLIHLTERQWNSLERHTQTLAVSKAEWLRHAMMRLLEEEQLAFLQLKKDEENV
jgi:hypothetical protein